MFRFLALKYFYDIVDKRRLDGYIQLRYVSGNGRKYWKNRYDMVYETYIGKLIKGMHVHHKDFIKLNDNPNNLEQITREEHAEKHGIIYNSVGGSSRMLGKHHSEETKKKMSIAAMGNKNSDISFRSATRPEWCEKISSTMRDGRRKRNLHPRFRKDVNIENVIELYKQGMNVSEIARKFDCPRGIIYKRIEWSKG